MSSFPAIAINDVSKRFPAQDGYIHALQGIELSIDLGEVVALVGPSGCGKSTLLSLIAGTSFPSAGSVKVFGESVEGVRPEIGMMFQSPVLLAWRTALQNVLLPIELTHGRGAARQAEGAAMNLLERVGLAGFEQALPSQLSGGMAQRVAICRMLISEPRILLLDEPFSALDEFTREDANRQLATIMEDSQRAAVFVTHNIQEAVFLADRVVAMTPRPGAVAGTVLVTLKRPRHPDVVTSPGFQEFVREVRTYLRQPSGETKDALHREANQAQATP